MVLHNVVDVRVTIKRYRSLGDGVHLHLGRNTLNLDVVAGANESHALAHGCDADSRMPFGHKLQQWHKFINNPLGRALASLACLDHLQVCREEDAHPFEPNLSKRLLRLAFAYIENELTLELTAEQYRKCTLDSPVSGSFGALS